MMRDSMTQFHGHLRLAVCTGLVGGFVFGIREGLLAVYANAFVQPGQYFFVYLAVPILAGVVLGTLVLLPFGAAVAAVRGPSQPREHLWLYAAAIAFVGMLSVVAPWAGNTAARLQEVGLTLTVTLQAAFWGFALILVVAVTVITGAAGAWYGRRAEHPLCRAAFVVLLVSLTLIWPIGRFLATDWKWGQVGTAPVGGAPLGKPNLLLISIDTLRADHLGSYGDSHRLTPHLDRLASEGVLFEQAITAAPWTLPAIASLFTGLYPHHHGAGAITNRYDPLGRSALPASTWTLATALHDQGYRTHAIVTNPYLALRYGLGQGFDTYENVSIESEAFLSFSETTAVRLLTWLRPDLVIGDRGETVSAHATAWLDAVHSRQPFFLWLHYVDPHPPYSRPGVTRTKASGVTHHSNILGRIVSTSR